MLSWNALILFIGERDPTALLIQNLTETTSLSHVNFFPLNETCSHVIKYLLVIRCKWRSSFTILFRLHRNRQWQKRRLHNRTRRFVFLHVQYMHADFVIVMCADHDAEEQQSCLVEPWLTLFWNKSIFQIITAPFNNMRTLKFKAQLTNGFFAAVNQVFGGSS